MTVGVPRQVLTITERGAYMDDRYESYESLADEVEVSTGTADCWTCLLIDA